MKPLSLHALVACALALPAWSQSPFRVRDLNPGAGSSYPREAADLGMVTILWAEDAAHGRELWRTDGSTDGTFLLADLTPGVESTPEMPLTVAGGRAFFVFTTVALGTELYATDGTVAGTRLVRDLLPNQTSTDPRDLTSLGSTLLFTARTVGLGERELYRSDGTQAGTVLVKDIFPGTSGSNPRFLTVLGHRAFFLANDGITGEELWATDGTAAGTQQVVDLAPGAAGAGITGVAAVGEALYLRIGNQPVLWISDGTGPGTRPLATIPNLNLTPNAALDGKAFFTARTPFGGEGVLWVTDGTAAGTVSLAAGGVQEYSWFQTWAGRLWFARVDAATGNEPWTTDGTVAGTRLFRDLWPGPESSYPGMGVPMASRLLFRATTQNPVNMYLWSTDGTPAGTVLLPVQAYELRSIGSRHGWLGGLEAATGIELWRTDATPSGIQRMTDLNPGTAWASPEGFRLQNGLVLFSADDGVGGKELFAISAGATNKRFGHGCAIGVRTPALSVTDPVLGGSASVAATGLAPGSVGLVLLGPPASPPLVVGGCPVYVDLLQSIVLGPFAAPSGSFAFPIAVPAAPELAGIVLAAQALAGPAAGPLGVDLTPAVLLTPGL